MISGRLSGRRGHARTEESEECRTSSREGYSLNDTPHPTVADASPTGFHTSPFAIDDAGSALRFCGTSGPPLIYTAAAQKRVTSQNQSLARRDRQGKEIPYAPVRPAEGAVFLPADQQLDSPLLEAISEAAPEDATFGFNSLEETGEAWIHVFGPDGSLGREVNRQVLNTALASLGRPGLGG
jgi:hypothetical protein